VIVTSRSLPISEKELGPRKRRWKGPRGIESIKVSSKIGGKYEDDPDAIALSRNGPALIPMQLNKTAEAYVEIAGRAPRRLTFALRIMCNSNKRLSFLLIGRFVKKQRRH